MADGEGRHDPEQLPPRTAQQEQTAEGERVGVDHPLQAARPEAETGGDLRQSHVHHGDIDGHHETDE
ncbi:hypothetical protein D3C83_53890 [compost metagenome]